MTFESFVNAGNGKESTSGAGSTVSLAKKVDEVNGVSNVNEVVKEAAQEVVNEVVSEAVNEAICEVQKDVLAKEVSNEALAVKVSFGNDIRRASFTPGSSFTALCELVAKLFAVDVTSVVLRYQDNEGDKITVSSDGELQEAVSFAKDTQKMLRIFVDNKESSQPQVAGPCFGRFRRHWGGPQGFHGGFHGQPRGPFNPTFHPSPFVARPFMSGNNANGTFSPAPNGPLGCPGLPAPHNPGVPTVYYGAPLFSHGTFSPATSDPLVISKEDAAERMRMNQERQAFKARKHAMKETLKVMKAGAVTQEDKDAIKEYKAKMKAELKNAWKGFKQQKKAKLDGFVGKYVSDITIADNSELLPNTPAVKTWRVKNDGPTVWPVGCQVILSVNHSDKVNAPERVVLERPVSPQEEMDVSVPFTTPTEPGRYVAYFRLATPDGAKFGQRLWMSFIIPSGVAKSHKLVDDTFEETPDAPQDLSNGFVVVSDLALD